MTGEEKTLRDAQRGDGDAFVALMTPRERKLYALCLRMLGNAHDAADCLQDVMLKSFRALPGYNDQLGKLDTWLYRIATNACLDALRKRRPADSLDALREAGFDARDERAPDPEKRALDAELHEALHGAIGQLAPDMRAAVVLRDVQGMSYEDCAQTLGIPLGTLKSRVNRARATLREKLSEFPELFDRPSVSTYGRRNAP